VTFLYSFFFHVFLGVVRITPSMIYFPVVKVLLRLFYVFSPGAKRNALESLTIAFGAALGLAEKCRLARVSFLNLAEGLAGFIYTFGRPEFAKRYFEFDVDDLVKFKALTANGRGAVIGVAHFGPFVWMMYRFIAEGYRVSVVAKPPRGAFLRAKFSDAFRYIGVRVILSSPLRQSVAESLRAINAGELLFMPVDQNYGAAGRLFVPFFGKPAATAPGPVIYAQKTGVPFFMAFALPAGGGKFRIKFEGPLKYSQTGDERADLTANTGMFTKIVEDYARQYPEQWSWLHRRWKCVPRDNERASVT